MQYHATRLAAPEIGVGSFRWERVAGRCRRRKSVALDTDPPIIFAPGLALYQQGIQDQPQGVSPSTSVASGIWVGRKRETSDGGKRQGHTMNPCTLVTTNVVIAAEGSTTGPLASRPVWEWPRSPTRSTPRLPEEGTTRSDRPGPERGCLSFGLTGHVEVRNLHVCRPR